MDYNSIFKEKLGKLLFLEIDKEGFKKIISIPGAVEFNNKDLYLPISPEYISSTAEQFVMFKFCIKSQI